MKRKIIILTVTLVLFTSLATPVFAENIQGEPTTKISMEGSAIVPFADEIEMRYRTNGGILQCRRWNRTKNCRFDPEWVNVA